MGEAVHVVVEVRVAPLLAGGLYGVVYDGVLDGVRKEGVGKVACGRSVV